MRIPILQILLSMLPCALPAAAQGEGTAWTYTAAAPTEICSAGTGAADDPYQVTDAQQLANIAYLVNETEETFAGKCFILKNDIVLNSGVLAAAEGGAAGSLRQWTPIGRRANPDDDAHSFCGSFDGGGHAVSGLYIDNSSKDADFLRYTGLFGAVGIGGLLRNIYIRDAYIAETVCRAGILCGYAYTEGTAVTDCTVRDSKIKIFKTGAGGSSSAAYQSGYIGGIAGAIGGNGGIAFCTTENVVIEHADGHNAYIGGIAGAVAGDAGFCSAGGSIVIGSDGITDDTSKRHAGGICAQAGGIVTDCLGAMDFTIQDNADVNAAGICFASGSAVMRCVNRGSFALTAPTAEETVLSDVLASGICMGATAVSDCANYGSFTLTGYTSVADTPPSLAGIYLDYTGTEQAERFDRCLCVSTANRFPAGLTGVRIAPTTWALPRALAISRAHRSSRASTARANGRQPRPTACPSRSGSTPWAALWCWTNCPRTSPRSSPSATGAPFPRWCGGARCCLIPGTRSSRPSRSRPTNCTPRSAARAFTSNSLKPCGRKMAT